jgi:hypothetical protein
MTAAELGGGLWKRPTPLATIRLGLSHGTSRMTKTRNIDPRTALDEIATSIKELVFDLENRETEGTRLTATEIQTIASQLQVHVENLLAASRSLPDEKPEE